MLSKTKLRFAVPPLALEQHVVPSKISGLEKPQTYLAFLVGFLVDLLVGALSGLPSGHEREGALVGTKWRDARARPAGSSWAPPSFFIATPDGAARLAEEVA